MVEMLDREEFTHFKTISVLSKQDEKPLPGRSNYFAFFPIYDAKSNNRNYGFLIKIIICILFLLLFIHLKMVPVFQALSYVLGMQGSHSLLAFLIFIVYFVYKTFLDPCKQN